MHERIFRCPGATKPVGGARPARPRRAGARLRQSEERRGRRPQRFEEAEKRAARGDERAEDAERRAADATQRLALAEARITELERALRQVERAAFDRTAHVGVQKQGDRTKELRAAKDETAEMQEKLSATEAALAETKSALIEANASLADATAKLAERVTEERPPPAASGLEIDVLRAERDVAKADLLRVQNDSSD